MKEEYIGTESKFKNIFQQLKELVEFSNENKNIRIQTLKNRKQSEVRSRKSEVGRPKMDCENNRDSL